MGVSGGGHLAIEGKLRLFVGGEEATVERARPWLQAIGKSLAYLGPVGRGLEGKLLNNLISIANYGMSAAIIDVGGKLGFSYREADGGIHGRFGPEFCAEGVARMDHQKRNQHSGKASGPA